ncbi:exported hypothetical protein [Crenothrix polyspora]|uniref:Uncharacterized protein n=1 Tax=Crenothrix polyspora TaxID=360316 RepID=A0A1R4HIK2_9GAMM|nr:hypothetical protein [Crenothrix polyspora]SJM96043.1 exported hypothetical protein [Crenothrix polyspora]
MLKFPYRRFISLVLCSATTVASATTLLVKTTYPGYIMEEYALYTTCTLDDQGLLIKTSRLNGLSSRKAVPEQFSVANIRKAIAEAVTGTIKKPEVQIVDASSTTYHAYHRQGGKMTKVFLYEDNGGMPEHSTYNESSAAMRLRNFIDAVCE